jgi:hypothetical protein
MRFYNHHRSKFGNRKTTVDGIEFASAKEARRYAELKLMQRAGEIRDLQVQPRFELLPPFRREGEAHRKIEYVADFSYTEKSGEKIVEDVKSAITKTHPVYSLKKKLLLFKYKDFTFLET